MIYTFQTRSLAIGVIIATLLLSLPAEGQENESSWTDASGRIRTRAELEDILRNHKEWQESEGMAGRQAFLKNADLTGAFLIGAALSGADLSDTVLTGADLSEALLDYANLARADLTGANLTGADLSHADLTGADLSGAVLSHAHLVDTDLSGANLARADLTDADLTGASLVRANMAGADLQATIFQPNSVPEGRYVATADNLPFLTYKSSPAALVQLRNVFKNGGFLNQERKITYALKRRQAELLWEDCNAASLLDCGAYAFNRIFFDITSHYGMHPSRPLLLAFAGWFLCTLIYSLFIHFPGASGVYVVKRGAYAGREHSRKLQIRHRAIPPKQRWKGTWKYPLHLFLREWRLARAAMFFSLMSAFNFGFRDLNFGRWLRMLTKREYDMKAIGWVRTVAGFQSLISMYLIALSVLTYFGRPFE